jgi:hypothetical protein
MASPRGNFRAMKETAVFVKKSAIRSKVERARAKLPPFLELLPGGDQLLNRLRAREVPRGDPAYKVCASVEVLQCRDSHHREPALQFCQVSAGEHFVGRSGIAGHVSWEILYSFFVRS